MDFKQLKYFCTLIEEESYSAAAGRLHISQPALSQQISALEDELNTMLVKRQGRKSFPTDVGLFLYRNAKTIIELTDNTKTEIFNYGDKVVGSLRIATSSTSVLFSEKAVNFYKRHPGIYLDIKSGNHDTILKYLESGICELAITDYEKFDGNTFKRHVLDRQSYMFIGTSEHIPNGAESIYLRDLKNVPMILRDNADYQMLRNVTLPYGFEPTIVAFVDSTENKVKLAKTGIGISLGSETCARQARAEGLNAVSIGDLDAKIERCIFWKDAYAMSVAAGEFLATMKNSNPII